MKTFILLFFIMILPFPAHSQQAFDTPAGELPMELQLEDEVGITHSVSEFSGSAFLLIPFYANCASTCPFVIEKLIREIPLSGLTIGSFRVLLFSFDPQDQPSDLAMIRDMHAIPPSWSIMHADALTTDTLMKGLGVRTVIDPQTKEYIHPDVLFIVAPGLRISGRLKGSEITASEITTQVQRANLLSYKATNDILAYSLPLGILGTLVCIFIIAHSLKLNISKSKRTQRIQIQMD